MMEAHEEDDEFEAFVGERSQQHHLHRQETPSPSASHHPQFTSDLQLLNEGNPSSTTQHASSSHHDFGGDLGPRVSQKWSLLGPIQYVNVPSTAPIYDPEQTDTFEVEPSDKKRWLRLVIWLLTLVSLGLFGFGIYHTIQTHSFILLIVFLILFVVSLAIYLRFQLLAANVQYLRNICLHESTPDYIDQLRSNRPKIVMTITCFHYTSAAGAPFGDVEDPNRREMVMEGDLKKVDTFTQSREFVFDSWEDQSAHITGLDRFDMIKLKLKTRIGFADAFTKQKFEEEQARFLEEHKGKDQLYKYQCNFEVPNLRPKSLSIMDPQRVPPMLSLEWYMTFSFFLMGWPYNYWLDIKSTKVNYLVQKVVKKEPTQEDLLRRVASERRVARKGTSASVSRTASKTISRQGTDATVERRNTSSQNEMMIPAETMPAPGTFVEYPYEFSSPRGNFH